MPEITSDATPLPLLRRDRAASMFALRHGRAITVGQFRDELARLAAMLPEAPAALNLAEDRYLFTLLFCAVLSRGQINLLPSARTPAAIAETAQGFHGCSRVDDGSVPTEWEIAESPTAAAIEPAILAGATALVAYTSGSTGEPQAHARRWGHACASHQGSRERLQSWFGPRFSVVATVPPQHMYGWEFTVLLPLQAEVAVHAGRPLFPADIASALAEMPEPRVLVTTPLHLRTLLASGVKLPPLAGILSATAPLEHELAVAVEGELGAPVYEIFGSTETCAMASRRTVEGPWWLPMPGVRLSPVADGCTVQMAGLASPLKLGDLIECELGSERFELIGRQQDLLEIAGKRMSLAALNQYLLAIPGVLDGAVFQQEQDGQRVRRIAALVVAPELTEATILEQLREKVDAVFLPRPLRRVQALPRNETGKLPRQALLAALQQAAQPDLESLHG
ncbi:AMP-binding protein [Frateuria aurantia]